MSSPVISCERFDVRFPSGGADCAAWLYLPLGVERPPLVILGHGVGARREMRLDAYAERFASEGIAALAFTYRHFGDSGGEPRQLLSVRRQLQDWEAAIAFGRSRQEVDPDRLALWGTSFGGGHALKVAARHPELRAVVVQCPFTSGLASSLVLGPRVWLRLAPRVLRDVISIALRRPPVTIPIAAAPGEPALMNAPDALSGYFGLMPLGMRFDNEVAARLVATLPAYRPGRAAAGIAAPVLFCVSDTDTVAPPGPTLRYAAGAPASEIRRYPDGHFDFYLGDAFAEIVGDQAAFLRRYLLA